MSDPITISRESTKRGGRYAARVVGHQGEGEMTYSQAGKTQIIVDHTAVPDNLRGLGVGQALAARVVADARIDGMKIYPLCPFFLATAKKHPDWHDIVTMPGQ